MVEGLLEAIRIVEFPISVERQRAERLEAAAEMEPPDSPARRELFQQAREARALLLPLQSVVRLLKVQLAHQALHYDPLPDAELRAIMAFIREHTQFDRFDDPTKPNANVTAEEP